MGIKIEPQNFNFKNRYPFNGYFKNPSPEMKNLMEQIGYRISEDIKDNMLNISSSSSGRSDQEIKESREYYASLVKFSVTKNPRKVPVITISSRGKNAVLYEDSHGNLSSSIAQNRIG